jgi:hypothetical protein
MSEPDEDLIDDAPRVAKRMRPKHAPAALRSESPRTDKVRRRKRGSKSEDKFHIPEDLKAELEARGLSAEFKRITYAGKEEDPDYFIGLAENGWEPLSLKSFPEFKKLMPSTHTADTFDKSGQRLMIRPKELTDEARAEDKEEAMGQVKGQLQSLKEAGQGEADRTLVKVKRSYERGVPID